MSMSREPYEFAELAAYNGRVGRGIVHTPEYAERMEAEQQRFNDNQKAGLIALGASEIKPGVWLCPAPPRRRWWKR